MIERHVDVTDLAQLFAAMALVGMMYMYICISKQQSRARKTFDRYLPKTGLVTVEICPAHCVGTEFGSMTTALLDRLKSTS